MILRLMLCLIWSLLITSCTWSYIAPGSPVSNTQYLRIINVDHVNPVGTNYAYAANYECPSAGMGDPCKFLGFVGGPSTGIAIVAVEQAVAAHLRRPDKFIFQPGNAVPNIALNQVTGLSVKQSQSQSQSTKIKGDGRGHDNDDD